MEKHENLADFDDYASDYREIHTKNVYGLSGADSDYFSEYKILEIKELLEGKDILDFGCGDGNTARFIEKDISSYNYTGVDISEKSIEEAKKKQLKNCNFQKYDGIHIPFEDEKFDLIFVSCVFHHIEIKNHLLIFKELYRVLKKDGKLVIFEHNPLNPLTLKTVHDCPFDVGVNRRNVL